MRIEITDSEIVNAVYNVKVFMQAMEFVRGSLMSLEDAMELVKQRDKLDVYSWNLIAAQYPQVMEPGWTRLIDTFGRVVLEHPD